MNFLSTKNLTIKTQIILNYNCMSETFEIRETGFEEIKKSLIIKALPLLLLCLVFGVGIASFNTKDKEQLLFVLPIMIPFLLIFLGRGIIKALGRQKMLFKSYRLTFTESDVTREQINTPTINIQFDNIKSIVKNKNGSYVINGKSSGETILIPAQIDNAENLEILFRQIKSIEEPNQPSFEEKYKTPITLLTLVCMVLVYVSYNKIIVLIASLIVSSMLIRSFIQILKSKNVDSKTKRGSYLVILVLASIIGVTIMKVVYL